MHLSQRSNITNLQLQPMREVAPPQRALNRRRSGPARLRRQTEGQRRSQRNPSSQAPHSSLDAFLASRPSGDSFGDPSGIRRPGSTRVLFQNIRGLKDSMVEDLYTCWKKENVGISLLAEMNTNWKMVGPGKHWFDRVRRFARRGHFSSFAAYEHQSTFTSYTFQWGGCTSTLLNEVSHSARQR
mmetsp:Transcript_23158/g.57127  ORF Transcript_23158/g.57127 Transcript_23158/m.57127 type:complete len:184 (-) Transcript_23158:1447-1998(-)